VARPTNGYGTRSPYTEKLPNGRWKGTYRTPQGRERSRTFDRKIDAERFIAGQETAKAKGEWLDPASARTRVNEFVPGWLDTKVDVGHQSLLNKGTAPKAHPALLWADAV